MESLSIAHALRRIGSLDSPLLLPAIQRYFVWGRAQICDLFDSIMQGFPIGTFLFWQVPDEDRGKYAFYEFIRDYCEQDNERYNRSASRSLPPGITGVLDGQQRLNSLFVALCGSHAAFIGGQGHHRSKRDNYPPAFLHLDLAFEPDEDDSHRFQFAFLNEWEQSPENWKPGRAWYPVSRILHCGDAQAVRQDYENLASLYSTLKNQPESRKQVFLSILFLLHQRIHQEKLIRYFPVENRDLTEALRIFIRANNGGTRVTDAEMIFSTIVASWPEGRAKIEALTLSLNQTGEGHAFGVTHLMRACLTLSGCPLRLKIESFSPASVDRIRENWDEISRLMRTAAALFHEWGLSGKNAVNVHSIIALALLLQAAPNANASELRQFCLRSLIGALYRRPEGFLRHVRDFAQQKLAQSQRFDLGDFGSFLAAKTGRSLHITSEQLEELLMLHIGDPRSYVLLSLLHPHHASHQQTFHKDHIHPNSGFGNLESIGVTGPQAQEWLRLKDLLPNLQLLQGQVNNEKRAKPFEAWVQHYLGREEDRLFFLRQNDIPDDVSLDFQNFEAFFQARKNRLRNRLKALLEVRDETSAEMSY